MRQRGNLRLLLNANLWAEMQVTKMDGGKVRRRRQEGNILACWGWLRG